MTGIDYSKPGAQAYTNSWADMLASWGVDYVKLDSITDKNTADIKAWYVAKWQPYARPGGFNDYDSIEVGNGSNDGLTPSERQVQLSLWTHRTAVSAASAGWCPRTAWSCTG